jgi:glutamate N-acetyltransferase/amino-acid N-acetyltransferase
MSAKPFEVIDGGITAPAGFAGAAVCCDIKPDSLDLMLLTSDRPASAAVTVTKNAFRAAPTFVTEEHTSDGQAQAIVCNSGNANAATGQEGMDNARKMAALAAEQLGVECLDVIVCSTGKIGHQLPMEKIEVGVRRAAIRLTRDAPESLAQAIMTTDTFPKMVSVQFAVGEKLVKMSGIAKGSGMISPDMATMLCFITTDLAIAPDILRTALQQAVETSFNCITVDGCMSTNDTVAILANGVAGNAPIESAESEGYKEFRAALGYVTAELAKMIARDGEGATKFVEITVAGAKDWQQARHIARTIANYDLVKTSLFGEDLNWGRIAGAIGAADPELEPATVTITCAGITTWDRGKLISFEEAEAKSAMQADEILIDVDVGIGDAQATVWTCDLTYDYIEENAGPDVYGTAVDSG